MKIVAPELKINDVYPVNGIPPKVTVYDIGYCKTGTSSDYIYVPIPKNSSTHTQNVLKTRCDIGIEDNFILNQELLSKKKIVVLREPYSRYISGLIEYLNRNKIEHDRVDFHDLLKTFIFDAHTLLQVQFLNDIDTDSCIFLKLGSTYDGDLSHLIHHTLQIDQKFTSKNLKSFLYNRMADKHKKMIMLNKLTEYLANNEEVVVSLKEYLAPDYDLFSSVKFYNNR